MLYKSLNGRGSPYLIFSRMNECKHFAVFTLRLEESEVQILLFLTKDIRFD